MAINLIDRFGRERARGSLESSFAQFQADRAVVGLSAQIRKNEIAILDFEASAICHLGDFGQYATLRREIKETEVLLSHRQAKRGFDPRQRAHLESELVELRKSLRNHACHACNDREAHARLAERSNRLHKENAGLRSRVENRTHVIARTFDHVCDVLSELGYLKNDETLAQGKILAKIYTESDLLLSEAIRDGFLERLSASELLAVISCVIFSARTQESQAPRIPTGNVQSALVELTGLWVKLESIEREHQVATQREPDFGFCWIAFRWANGHSLQSVLKGSDLSVGDFVRSMKQLIDLMGQIAVASDSLRPKCMEAIKKLDRGVVTYLVGES